MLSDVVHPLYQKAHGKLKCALSILSCKLSGSIGSSTSKATNFAACFGVHAQPLAGDLLLRETRIA